jgi:hypothetical protein
MITNEQGDKCTPKELAQEILMRDMEKSVERWLQTNTEREEQMTERELSLVNDQILKLMARAGKAMGWRVVTQEQANGEDECD